MLNYTPEQIQLINKFLQNPLGPEFLLKRVGPGGKILTYIPTDQIINIANRIFGVEGWSVEIKSLTTVKVGISKILSYLVY
jgi:DNA repair and recombination protein RAD52